MSMSLYADESDEDQEATPKLARNPLKKRISEAFIPEHDTHDGPRIPLRSVNINDDAAEKRRRRKSTKIAVIENINAVAGPSSEGAHEGVDDPTRPGGSKQKQPLHSVAPPKEINVSFDVMTSNFEEWMKMATDNKINAANTWSFALIDYFHDMSLLRNNDDNSINFQRASCTLDGCVKIWTSRVDSVGTETSKLMSNLQSGRDGDGDLDEDEDGNNSDNPDADQRAGKKKKSSKPTATLVKDPNQLKNKKLDLEFSVDPLFKKTRADFDEGGAEGLLMNHLCLGVGSEGAMRVVFDGSDSMGKVEEEVVVVEPEEEVDLSYLRKQFLPDLIVLEDKAISHSLEGFTFCKDVAFDETTFYLDNTHRVDSDDEDNDVEGGGDVGDFGDQQPAEDFFSGADAVGDDYAGAEYGPGDEGGGGGDEENASVGEGDVGPPGAFVPFDPRRLPNERDLVMAMTDADADGGALDYFDQNFLKNWAGPEHWKLRKVIRRPEADSTGANKSTKPTRSKKEVFKIDFLTPPDPDKDLKEMAKELFAPVTGKGAGINLPGTGPAAAKKGKRKTAALKERKDDHKLPDDMHFSSRQLVTLFLKPKFFLKMRGRRARVNDGDGEVDEDFWAQAAADQAAARGNEGQDGDETNGDAIPFNTQFFHDDYDDGPGFDDPFDGDGTVGADQDAGEQDLLAATQGQSRRVRPEFVNYAKRAKRVDVRKLKDNIWKGLDIVVPKVKKDKKENAEEEEEEEDEEKMEVDDTSEPTPTDPSISRQFSQVISGLQKSYPRDKMEEISTSFCFICLLHLANEQGLKLESSVDGDVPMDTIVPDDEEEEDKRKVGDIWDIKIYRDPNATQSA